MTEMPRQFVVTLDLPTTKHRFTLHERYGQLPGKFYRDGDFLDVVAPAFGCSECGCLMQDFENGVLMGCDATYYGA